MPPDPGAADTLDDLAERLRLLKVWAGNPSHEAIKDRVNAAWAAAGRPASELVGKTTVVDCFRHGRRRLNSDLLTAVVTALNPDPGYVAQWRQALRVLGAESQAAAQVRVQDTLPDDLANFTGRTDEIDKIRRLLRRGGAAAVIASIEGMAGVGKTRLAIHVGHLLVRDECFEQVLFVNLRGFHPDPGQPPADPGAVLEGFLRLLGLPGQRIPYDLKARAAAYRDLLAGKRVLVLLDNAVGEDQVRPLLPDGPGSLTLVTSRRRLASLHRATHVDVDVFAPEEALEFLTRAGSGVPVGADPDALARVANDCGYLPLALSLLLGHMRAKRGWSATDHADWLAERRRDRRLDTGVELALGLSYQHLPDDRRHLLRLLAMHPGHEVDAYAAAALAGINLATARRHLRQLCRDHLVQQATPGRYTFHDLVRAFAAGRAIDEDPPPARRTALTRLFDYYLATAAAATDTLHPVDVDHRPRIPRPGTPTPLLTGPEAAAAWLDSERPTLVAVAVHAAPNGWPIHAVRLSHTLYRYLDRGYYTDALIVHGQARDAARELGDPAGEANALTGLGVANLRLGRPRLAAEVLAEAVALFRDAGDRIGEARAVGNLGAAEERLGRQRRAAKHFEQARALFRQAGDRAGEARALVNIGYFEGRVGRYESAAEHLAQALVPFRDADDLAGQARVLDKLGTVEERLGRYGPAIEHHERALTICRKLGDVAGEAWALTGLGDSHNGLGRPERATEYHERALDLFRDIGERDGEASALNGLGQAAAAVGDHHTALAHHAAALAVATETNDRDQQARAHTGLGRVYSALADPARARQHIHKARAPLRPNPRARRRRDRHP